MRKLTNDELIRLAASVRTGLLEKSMVVTGLTDAVACDNENHPALEPLALAEHELSLVVDRMNEAIIKLGGRV